MEAIGGFETQLTSSLLETTLPIAISMSLLTVPPVQLHLTIMIVLTTQTRIFAKGASMQQARRFTTQGRAWGCHALPTPQVRMLVVAAVATLATVAAS